MPAWLGYPAIRKGASQPQLPKRYHAPRELPAYKPTGWLLRGGFFLGQVPEGSGYGLPMVYAMWLLVVVILYFPCRWFADLKQRRRNWWLSYL